MILKTLQRMARDGDLAVVKVVEELLRHANSRITLDLYAQAGMQGSGKHLQESAFFTAPPRGTPNCTCLPPDCHLLEQIIDPIR